MPIVKTQVDSQIRVRDLSTSSVSVRPADYSSWADLRAELVAEKKAPVRAQQAAELAAAADDEAKDRINAEFAAQMNMIEADVDHTAYNLSMELAVSYNFLSE